MRIVRWCGGRALALVVFLLEALSHCATEYDWLDESLAHPGTDRCPDYIPEWLMESGAPR